LKDILNFYYRTLNRNFIDIIINIAVIIFLHLDEHIRN
jgi:hypothetical protein